MSHLNEEDNTIKLMIVEPHASMELDNILYERDFNKLSNAFERADSKIDSSDTIDTDSKEWHELDYYFPIDSAEQFFKYAEDFGMLLAKNNIEEGYIILGILSKYRKAGAIE